jgi:hypothetical protein
MLILEIALGVALAPFALYIVGALIALLIALLASPFITFFIAVAGLIGLGDTIVARTSLCDSHVKAKEDADLRKRLGR